MSELVNKIWAWVVSVGAAGWGFFVGSEILTVLGVIGTLMAIYAQYRVSRNARAQEKLALARIEEISGSGGHEGM